MSSSGKQRETTMRPGSTRLGRANLDRLPPGIRRPAYDRSRVTSGIVHLGLGAFHRAHQAVVIDDCLAAGATSWGIVGASLRSPDTRDALAPQDHLYTVAIRAAEGTEHRSHRRAARQRGRAREPGTIGRAHGRSRAFASSPSPSPRRAIATTPQTGDLDDAIPTSCTISPISTRRARRPASSWPRWRAGAAQASAPFTVLSCDNLAANGHTVAADRDAIRRAASNRISATGSRTTVAFPSTMVDRIVPATTDGDRDAVSPRARLARRWPVMTEPFTPMGDRGPLSRAGRPDLAAAGVELVDRRRAVRADEAAPAQRQPFDAGLSRLSRRLRDRRRHHARSATSRASPQA